MEGAPPAVSCPEPLLHGVQAALGVRVLGISVEAFRPFAEGKQMCCVSAWPRSSYGVAAYITDTPSLLLTLVIQTSGFRILGEGLRAMSHTAFQKQFRVSWERIRKKERMKRELGNSWEQENNSGWEKLRAISDWNWQKKWC